MVQVLNARENNRHLCSYYFRNVTPKFYELFSQHPDEEAINCDSDKERYYNFFAFGNNELARNDGRKPTQVNTIMDVTLRPVVDGAWNRGAYISNIRCQGGDEFGLKRCEVLSMCTADRSAEELIGILKKANDLASGRGIAIRIDGGDIVVSGSSWKTDVTIPVDYFLWVLDVSHVYLELFIIDGARSMLCGNLLKESSSQHAVIKFLLSCVDILSYREVDRLQGELEERVDIKLGMYGDFFASSFPVTRNFQELFSVARRVSCVDDLEKSVKDFEMPF